MKQCASGQISDRFLKRNQASEPGFTGHRYSSSDPRRLQRNGRRLLWRHNMPDSVVARNRFATDKAI